MSIKSASNPLERAAIGWLAGLLFFILTAAAQESQFATIAGTVVDDSTSAPLSNVNIYIANSTLGGNTNEQGSFEVHNIPMGTHDIVASRIGYAFFSIRVKFSEPRARRLEIRLKPVNVQMGEVVVSGLDPTEWRKQLEKFNDLFIGTTRNSKQCRITNPEVLDFKTDSTEVFEASARRPVQIENMALANYFK